MFDWLYERVLNPSVLLLYCLIKHVVMPSADNAEKKRRFVFVFLRIEILFTANEGIGIFLIHLL